MSNNKTLILVALVLASLMWFSACTAIESRRIETETTHPTEGAVIPSETIFPASSPTKFPTPAIPIFNIPTITANQEAQLAEALQSENCELPCYLLITPGKTSWSSAQLILSELGANYIGDYYESGLRGYEYTLKIGVPELSEVTPVSNNTSKQLEIHQYVIFTVDNSIVQRIQVAISTLDQEAKFHGYWSRYSPQQIFARLGTPEAVYFGRIYSVNDGAQMAIAYESLGIVMEFEGRREENTICPSFETGHYVGRNFFLTNIGSTLNLLPESERVPPTDRDVWLPITDVLGISVNEFYNQILSSPSVCFDVKVTDP